MYRDTGSVAGTVAEGILRACTEEVKRVIRNHVIPPTVGNVFKDLRKYRGSRVVWRSHTLS